jgi:hypothetical protein
MLSSLSQKLDIINREFPNIIYGGCGIFAWTLSDILTKRGITNSIVYVLEVNSPVGAYRCDIKFRHFYVYINIGGKDFYIDSSGVSKYSDIIKMYNSSLCEVSVNKLYLMLLDKCLWNNKFSFSDWDKLSNLMYKIMLYG